LLLMLPGSILAQQSCPTGTLWEPYTEVCAEVRDVRNEFLPADVLPAGLEGIEKLVPGKIAVGTYYHWDQLVALKSGRLHTRMFVYPAGLQPDGPFSWIFTTATSRVHHGLEVVGVYKGANPDNGQLGLYAWPCFDDYPCPDGKIASGWQWFRDFSTLTCNITQVVDQGAHAQKALYYANHTDQTDDGTPPRYKSAVYLWNYCDDAWDLAWEHTYREDKVDCSIQGSGCGWWGPGIEVYSVDPHPQIVELGFEDSMLYHDGVWSNLLPEEAGFSNPADSIATAPWALVHLDPNHSYGVGNWINDNDAPVIVGQPPLEILEDRALLLDESSLVITDPDVDPAFHAPFELTLYGGANYTHSGKLVTPAINYSGTLAVPVTVSDGAAESAAYELQISVLAVNDAPVFIAQNPLETMERTPLEIVIADITFTDPDNDPGEISLLIQDGFGYSRTGNTITPELAIVGPLPVSSVLSDGITQSASFDLEVWVSPDDVPPEITLLGAATVTLTVGASYQDAGATAIDDVDGDISDRIVVDNPVDANSVGTYTVTYTVSDIAGNSTSATRTVVVRQAPVTNDGGGGSGSFSTLFICLLVFICLIDIKKARMSRALLFVHN
jgi:hypothetical protein